MRNIGRARGSRRSRHSIVRVWVLALAMSGLASLVSARPAEAVENCPGIMSTLVGLRSQYQTTTAQMEMLIVAKIKPTESLVAQYMNANTAATNIAAAQLLGLGTCQNGPLVGNILSMAIVADFMGADTAKHWLAQVHAEAMLPGLLIQQQIALMSLMDITGQASPSSKQVACLSFSTALLTMFPQIKTYCGR